MKASPRLSAAGQSQRNAASMGGQADGGDDDYVELSIDEAEDARRNGAALQWRDGTRAVLGWHDSDGGEITEHMTDLEWRIKP